MREAMCMCYDRILPENQPDSTQALVLLTNRMWNPGDTITCSFIGGTQAQRNKVIQTARMIEQYANLKFQFLANGVGMSRIAFNPSLGAWSYIGRDILGVPQDQATMNLGFDQNGTYAHEWLHQCAAIHEHQSPFNNPIKWNREQVYHDLSGPPNNWDRATIDQNMFAKYSVSQTNGTAFDPKSVMLYSWPASWTIDGFHTEPNATLSELDILWLKTKYPFQSEPPVIPDPADPSGGGYDITKTIRVTGQGPRPTITIG